MKSKTTNRTDYKAVVILCHALTLDVYDGDKNLTYTINFLQINFKTDPFPSSSNFYWIRKVKSKAYNTQCFEWNCFIKVIIWNL